MNVTGITSRRGKKCNLALRKVQDILIQVCIMASRKTNSFIKNFLVRREILEQVKAGTCELIDNTKNVKYILNGKEVLIANAIADDDQSS